MRRAMMVLVALATMGCAPEVECYGLWAECACGGSAMCVAPSFDPDVCSNPDPDVPGCRQRYDFYTAGCGGGEVNDCLEGFALRCLCD